MSTRSEMVAMVQNWLPNRPDLTPAVIIELIHRVYISLAMPFRFHEVEVTHDINVTANDGSYPLLNTDVYAIKWVRDLMNGTKLEPMGEDEYDEIFDQTITGFPTHYVRSGTSLYIHPVPDFNLSPGIRVKGWKLPARLADDNAVPVYPEDWHFIIEMMTASLGAFMIGMEERGMVLQNIALGSVSGRQEAQTLENLFGNLRVTMQKVRPSGNREDAEWLR